jgi:hypothetical protein
VNGYFDQLGEQLEQAADRVVSRRRRARTVRRVELMAIAALVVIVGLGVRRHDTAQAGGAKVTPLDQSIDFPLDRSLAPDVLLESLHKAGFAVRVTERTTGPSRAGKLIDVSSMGPGYTTDARVQVLTAVTDDPVDVSVGVLTTTGLYEAPTNPFDLGEPLHCRGWTGQRAADLARLVPPGITVTFSNLDGRGATIEPSELGGSVIDFGAGLGPTTIQVFVRAGPAVEAPACS